MPVFLWCIKQRIEVDAEFSHEIQLGFSRSVGQLQGLFHGGDELHLARFKSFIAYYTGLLSKLELGLLDTRTFKQIKASS